MRIHKEGHAIILVIWLVLFVVVEMIWVYFNPTVFYILLVPAVVLALMTLMFFRNPNKRKAQPNAEGVVAPADGTIVTIEKVFEPEVLKSECVQVSIFMSIYNIHKNFFPISGEVSYFKHHSGHYHRAILPKSSSENERSTIVINNEKGQSVLCRQVAGAVARRVVSYVKEGQQVEQATEMGFIKFGSRVDLFLPLDADIQLKVGDKTKGSQTLVALLK